MDTKQLIVTRQFFLPDGFQGIVDIFADNLKSVTKAFHLICATLCFPARHTHRDRRQTQVLVSLELNLFIIYVCSH